jgi:aminopeptidase-like protein
LGRFYLITVYWIAYTNYYHNDKFDEEMGICLESIDQNIILLDSPHFSRRNSKLYHKIFYERKKKNKIKSMLEILNVAEGKLDLLDIANNKNFSLLEMK